MRFTEKNFTNKNVVIYDVGVFWHIYDTFNLEASIEQRFIPM